MDLSIEAWACQQLWIMTKEFEIVEIGVREGVDLGSGNKDSLHPNMVLWRETILLFNVV